MFGKENVEYSEIFRSFFSSKWNLQPQTYYNTWKLKTVAQGAIGSLGNILGTHWEHWGKKKERKIPPLQNPKEKKNLPL